MPTNTTERGRTCSAKVGGVGREIKKENKERRGGKETERILNQILIYNLYIKGWRTVQYLHTLVQLYIVRHIHVNIPYKSGIILL